MGIVLIASITILSFSSEERIVGRLEVTEVSEIHIFRISWGASAQLASSADDLPHIYCQKSTSDGFGSHCYWALSNQDVLNRDRFKDLIPQTQAWNQIGLLSVSAPDGRDVPLRRIYMRGQTATQFAQFFLQENQEFGPNTPIATDEVACEYRLVRLRTRSGVRPFPQRLPYCRMQVDLQGFEPIPQSP